MWKKLGLVPLRLKKMSDEYPHKSPDEKNDSKRIVAAVTGPMAAGKNYACCLLEKMGFASIDADLLGHAAIENKKDVILETFAPYADEKKISLVNNDGTVNRRNLGKILFDSPSLLEKQESIVFPEINRLIEKFIAENQDRNVIVNATVLYKMPLVKKMDFILFIDCPEIIRVFRAKKRDKMPLSQILSRFKSQKNLFAKYKFSNADTFRVWNTFSSKCLEKKLSAFLKKYKNGI